MQDPSDLLLAELRDRLGLADLEFSEPPVRLSGGFFTDNYAFTLSGAPHDWSGPLVLRLFPAHLPPTQAQREAVVQTALAEQGFPAPRVLAIDASGDTLGRAWFVMERLPGRTLQGGIALREIASSARPLLRMPTILADVIVRLQRVDPAPVVAALGDLPTGVDRWLERAESIASEMPGLSAGARWLLDNVPEPAAPLVVCHGDLWLGNLMAEHGKVTGVIDWTVSSIAEPALEIGFALMPFTIVPVPMPRALERVAVPLGGHLARRLVKQYRDRSDADLRNQRYYEAMRVVVELANVYRWRTEVHAGRDPGFPQPTWGAAGGRMTEHFRSISGVDLTLPPPT
jgi:aminoglycoside phosphotransferase (APT) family kinase protein